MTAVWSTGVAEIVGTTPRGVKVACPHCNQQHEHTRAVLGSKSVAAGCHAGFSRCREYRVVDLGRAAPERRRAVRS